MEDLEVKAQISNGNHVLIEWREFPSSNLPALINSVAHLREFLNEFLTNVQNQSGSSTIVQEDGLLIYNENFEGDEEREDSLLETIQELRNLKEASKSVKKRNVDTVKKPKKLKK